MENAQIFAGNLSWTLEEDELRTAFETIGPVTSCRIIFDRETTASKGYGFIQMQNAADANRAIAELEGRIIRGRALRLGPATGGPQGRRLSEPIGEHGRT